MDDRYGFSPVPLTGEYPVTELIIDHLVAKALLLYHVGRFLLKHGGFHAVPVAGIDHGTACLRIGLGHILNLNAVLCNDLYNTRPDTLYGATFMVLAPEHELAKSLATDATREAVEKYIFDSSMRSNVDRMQAKEKTGVFTGSYAINPLNGEKTPIWL